MSPYAPPIHSALRPVEGVLEAKAPKSEIQAVIEELTNRTKCVADLTNRLYGVFAPILTPDNVPDDEKPLETGPSCELTNALIEPCLILGAIEAKLLNLIRSQKITAI